MLILFNLLLSDYALKVSWLSLVKKRKKREKKEKFE